MRHRPTIKPLAFTPIEPRYWPCGSCHAEAGEICRTATGNPATSHVDRYRSIQLWERYGRSQTWVNGQAQTWAADARLYRLAGAR